MHFLFSSFVHTHKSLPNRRDYHLANGQVRTHVHWLARSTIASSNSQLTFYFLRFWGAVQQLYSYQLTSSSILTMNCVTVNHWATYGHTLFRSDRPSDNCALLSCTFTAEDIFQNFFARFGCSDGVFQPWSSSLRCLAQLARRSRKQLHSNSAPPFTVNNRQ